MSSNGSRPLQPSNVRLIQRLVSKTKVQQDEQQQQQDSQEQQATPVKRLSSILKKVSSFDLNAGACFPSPEPGLEYQSPLSQDGLIMDPPTPLFFSFTYGLYSDNSSPGSAPGLKNGGYAMADEELSSSCGSSTVEDPSPPPRKAHGELENKKKKKVTFAVPEAVTFTEKEEELVAPSPRLARSISINMSSTPRLQPNWKRQSSAKPGRVSPEHGLADPPGDPSVRRRCSWITTKSDAAYIEYHDSEWGVPVHDDKMLFELLVLAGAQAEQSWSEILSKREHYRKAFAGFDAELVSKFDEEKFLSLEGDPEIVQHEGKLRQIVDNAKCVVEVVQEFGSLDKFLWNFFNRKPIINRYKTSQQVPIKSAKSDYISRELMKRGFRFVGPTIMYSFMQAAGMTNDHIVQCFRHQECVNISNKPGSGSTRTSAAAAAGASSSPAPTSSSSCSESSTDLLLSSSSSSSAAGSDSSSQVLCVSS